mmetsp:Transcript_129447/g.224798  ORF Transcript_129447/g.224798 Transcript_129447/m.224798 type:complete len:504 (+) Transcript_129447:127-1638(+)
MLPKARIEEAVAQAAANPRDDESLPARVKEVFVMFDEKNNGFLTIDQVSRLLKKLSGFTSEQIAAFCADIDRSKDGKVSYRELVDWVRRGGGKGGEQVAKAIIRETNKRAERIKAAFDRYDADGGGSLDLAELKMVLKTLGAFTNDEIRKVLLDLDRNGDGDISFAEFRGWVVGPTTMKEVVKAKCILAPSDADGVESVFYNFCGAGHADMDGKSFLKLCKDVKLLTKTVNETAIDLIFQDIRVKPKRQRRVDFSQFEMALEIVAEKRGSSVEDIRNAMLQCTHPVLKGTSAEYTRFHDAPNGIKAKALARRAKIKARKIPGEDLPPPPADPLSVSVDNSNTWKTFGIHSPAGRSLKRLYEKYVPPRPLASGNGFKARWPPGLDTYVTVNALGACNHGLRLRNSMYLSDICTDPLAVVPWGASIQGDLVDACWLKVGNLYLPASVNGVRLLKRWAGPGPPPTPHSLSLGRSSSLPAIRNEEKAFDLDLKGLKFKGLTVRHSEM